MTTFLSRIITYSRFGWFPRRDHLDTVEAAFIYTGLMPVSSISEINRSRI